MRLAFFFENHVIGGGSKYVLDCLNSVLTHGDEVTLISNRGALSPGELDQLQGPLTVQLVPVFERTQSVGGLLGQGLLAAWVRKMLILFSPLMLLLNLLVIWRQLGRLRPEVLVACNGGYPAAESALAAVLAARLRRVPSILVIMSQPQPRRNVLPGYERLLDWLVFSATQSFVLNSVRQGQALIEVRGAPAARVRTVYNGIAAVDPVRTQPPLTGPEIVLGVACRLDPMKGLDDLIRALALLDGQNHVKLRILGEGEHLTFLRQLAQQLGVGGRVTFAGFKSGQELLDEYSRFDIYVFPSHWEGLPYALLEAMRASLPIIATAVGGIPEAIRDERESLLVPPRTPQLLKTAIGRLLSNPKEAQALGKAARLRFETMFSLEKMHADFVAAVIATRAGHPQQENSPDSAIEEKTRK
jgi:glycosyltransferase involved in cell wall biosynthesis